MAERLSIPVRPSRRGEPTWEALEFMPEQGEWTAEEYLALDTDRLVEFTDGKLEVLPVPDGFHQMIAFLLAIMLHNLRIGGRPGRVFTAGFKLRLRRGKWRMPDVLYLRPENEHLHKNEWWTHADFAVEVVSRNRPKRDYVTKRREYAKAGIPEYWILDPLKRQLLVLVLDPGAAEYREAGTFAPGDVVRSATLPGFEVDFAKLLAEAEGPPKA